MCDIQFIKKYKNNYNVIDTHRSELTLEWAYRSYRRGRGSAKCRTM